MAKIIITGIAGYNGEYDIDLAYLTNKDLHTIKRIAGVRAGEIQAALNAEDNDLAVAFTVIALERNGKAVHEDVLWNAQLGCINLQGDPVAEEEDALPPPNGPEDDGSESVRKPSSGPDLSEGSGHLENGQSRTGLRPSELSVT